MQTVWFSGCRNAPVESKHCRTCIEATSKPRRSTRIGSVAAAYEHRNETASKPRRGRVAAASRPRPTCVAEVTLDRGEKPCRRPNFLSENRKTSWQFAQARSTLNHWLGWQKCVAGAAKYVAGVQFRAPGASKCVAGA